MTTIRTNILEPVVALDSGHKILVRPFLLLVLFLLVTHLFHAVLVCLVLLEDLVAQVNLVYLGRRFCLEVLLGQVALVGLVVPESLQSENMLS